MFNNIYFLGRINKFFLQVCILCLCLLAVSFFSAAQSTEGKLTGKLTDGATNEPLVGVSISAKGKSRGVASITDGTYILSLSPGTYTITYSSSGYKTKEISGVVIKAKETTFLDIILDKTTKELTKVVITSNVKKESTSSVYSAQKRSSAASDGISQEAITKTPDTHAGQILKRVTGINILDNRFVVVRGLGEQYNQTMLNGAPMTSTETDRNAFSFDLIPSAAIDNITVNKTATPDMPGNFAGGIVQVNTKDFPANDFFSITAGTGFSDKTIGKDFYSDKRNDLEILGFGGKIRDLPKEYPTHTSRVPFYAYNIQEQYRLARMFKNNLAPVNNGPSRPNENIQLGYGKTFKFENNTQLGIVAALSQRKTELIEEETTTKNILWGSGIQPPGVLDSGKIFQANYYSENTRYRYNVDFGGVFNLAYRFGTNKITLKSLYTRVFKNQYINRSYLFIDGFVTGPNEALQGISHIVSEKSIFNSILSGEHRTGKNNETRLEWNINTTFNNTYTPDTRNFVLVVDSVTKKIRFNTNLTSVQHALSEISRLWTGADDFVYGGAFNITTPFILAGNKQLLKGGMLFQNRKRKATGTIVPIEGATAYSIDSLLEPSNFFPGGATINAAIAEVTGSPGNYDAGSSLLAAYGSLENKIGNKFRMIWGLRVENYQQNVLGYKPVFFDGFSDPEKLTYFSAARTSFDFLPSVNIIYSPVTSINVRAAYSNTVIRPELKDLADFPSYDFQTFRLTLGNPLLKSTTIRNYDLKFEWFPSAGEIISFSAFYKKIINPIEYARGTRQTDLLVPVNTGDAFVKGIEGEIRKKIDFIPGAPWLKQVTIFGNATLLRSKVKAATLDNFLVDLTGEHTLAGQAEYIVNTGASVLLFKNTFEATVSFNKTGDHISDLGSAESVPLINGNNIPLLPHLRVKARDMLDLVVTQSFLRNKCKLKFNISNLLKEPYILYQDMNGNEKFDDPVIVKKNSPLASYINGIDNAISYIKAQRSFSFSVSYTF